MIQTFQLNLEQISDILNMNRPVILKIDLVQPMHQTCHFRAQVISCAKKPVFF